MISSENIGFGRRRYMSSKKAVNQKQPEFGQVTVMIFISIFQVLSMLSVISKMEEDYMNIVYIFFGYIAFEWIYMMFNVIITGKDYFELEAIAFFLSGVGLTVCATLGESYAIKQLIAIGIGLFVYLAMLLIIRDVQMVNILRYPAAIGSILLLIVNLLLAKTTNGALNWITIGGFSIQPSEIVKIIFIFVGAVSLDRLLSKKSLYLYIGYSLTCVGLLFLMRDFGTALIFFFTFVIIAYMRSGDVRTLFLICAGALMGAVLIIYFKPYVANRFAAYRHVWENMDSTGYQQTRVLMYSASGGLFGLGIGEGKLRDVFAASTDLVFGLICEEMGLITGIAVLIAFACIGIFAIKAAKGAASTFYAIAAVAASSLIIFQLSLNVFGVTDLLPLTGVTLPFISRGGSSIICSWGLLAYIRAAGAPFKLPAPDIAIDKRARNNGGMWV